MEINNKWYLQTKENDPYFWRVGLLVDSNTVLFSGVDTPVVLPKELIAPLPHPGEECTVLLRNSSIPTEAKAKFVNIADTPLGIPQAYIVQLEDGSYFWTASIRFDESVQSPISMELQERNEKLKKQIKDLVKDLKELKNYSDPQILKLKIDFIISSIDPNILF